MTTWFSEMRAVLIAITGTLGIAWFALEPAAREFVKTEVTEEGFASSVEMAASNMAVKENSKGIKTINESAIRMEEKQKSMKDDIGEVKRDLKELLRELRRRPRLRD